MPAVVETLRPEHPFVEIGEVAGDAAVSEIPGGYALEIPVPGATVDEIDVELDPPFLNVYVGGGECASRSFALLASIDTDSIRVRLEDGVLHVAARRRWGPARRLPITSDFVWGGHVGFRAVESLPVRHGSTH
jgi:HSP20 family molecular chaperone IbpA